ncbi:hypothetical protein [Pedobacter suwonensis]|uniref:hypothetical protein n=1 Tax=Pedobacter suwonensis TaxID=332999 RepID=UPI0011A22195|nr:hypothetical protein [Pedobacter suwonensis]
MENLNNLNFSRLNDITIQEVKALPMFKHFSDSEAEEVIRTLKRFSEIIVKDHLNKENRDIER